MREWWGIARSVAIYWRPGRQRGLRRLYHPFIRPGDLVFDVGAHLGDRSAAFHALGARVVALEPQSHLVPILRRIVGWRRRITIRTEAVGAAPGWAELAVSTRTPTVSTVAAGWRAGVIEKNPGFGRVRWDRTEAVPMTTLDRLIAEFGVPRFLKLDVEGHEAEALAGLTLPVEALSFEFVTGGLEVALACIRRLEALGAYEYNGVSGEARALLFDSWQDPQAMMHWLEGPARRLSSGDVYARRTRSSGGSAGA